MSDITYAPFFGVSLPVDISITGGFASGNANLGFSEAEELSHHALRSLALSVGAPPEELITFLRFLMSDPELQDRFTAFKAGERIMEGAER